MGVRQSNINGFYFFFYRRATRNQPGTTFPELPQVIQEKLSSLMILHQKEVESIRHTHEYILTTMERNLLLKIRFFLICFTVCSKETVTLKV